MNKLQITKDFYGLELLLDSDESIYEINLWTSEGSKVQLSYWKWNQESGMCLVFVGTNPFITLVDKDFFWQLIEYGQFELDSFFGKGDNIRV